MTRTQALLVSTSLPPGTTFGALGIPYGTDFADTEIKGDAWGIGYNLGVIFEVNEKLTLGARYLSRQKITTDNADATFVQDPTGLVLTGGNPFGLPAGTPIDALVAGQFQPGGLLVDQKASSGLRAISRHGSATPGVYARERSRWVRTLLVGVTAIFPGRP